VVVLEFGREMERGEKEGEEERRGKWV